MSIVSATGRLGGAGLLLTLCAVAGCAPRLRLVPVEGTVKINGTPAGNISVQFMPDALQGGKGPTSFATTDKDGKFRLMTYDGQEGAVVGPHRAVLADLDEERPPQGREAKKRPRLSAEFTLPTTPLVVAVKENGGPVVLEAKSP